MKRVSPLLFFLAAGALMVLMHLPYLKMPYYWDELGQFVPSALDIFQFGAWIPISAVPNVHPPGVMAYTALAWKIFGYSIPVARVAMLLIGAAGVLFTFLLARRLSPCFAVAAPLFLVVSPMFYTQSMMVQLDMPAMTLTALALWLFLDRRYFLCALACTALVLVKETGISTPFVLACWLLLRERRLRESFYFVLPAIGLGAWLLFLHHGTGSWTGNPGFAHYNVSESLQLAHIVDTLDRRLYFLFLSDGHFLGALALIIGWRILRGRDWAVIFLVAGAQLLLVTVLGGASLDRYALTVFPILYVAMAAAASVYTRSWRWVSTTAMASLLVLGWFWNPPYAFSLENNLAMTDFVALQQEAARYLEMNAPTKRIASVWPFTDDVKRPEFGYVEHRLQTLPIDDFRPATLASLDRENFDVLVVFCRIWSLDCGAPKLDLMRRYVQSHWGVHTQATPEQIHTSLGLVPIVRWTRHGQWIQIYAPEAHE